jgi:hypothetical protein
MSILQISKLQQRSGNLVDLPQLDEGEFGWASDNNRLFIGKTSPNQNVEVLTAYSNIAFSQIDGVVGNLNINPVTIAAGEVLVYDGTNWVNRGGIAGGNINLGNISNVTIGGGAIGYILQTDGLGNLSWTTKGTSLSFIQNVSQANPGVLTTTTNHNLTKGATVTITGSQGMTQLNGNSYYANVLTSNTFSLYSDSGLTTPVNTISYTAYAYTSVSNTTTGVNTVTVGNSSFLSVNKPIQFVGNMSTSGILNNTTYYINAIPSGTSITISSNVYPNGTAGPVIALQTVNGLSASVYETGGQLTSLVGSGSSGANAAGTNTQVQFNNAGVLGSATTLTFDFAQNILTVGGNANVGNLNATGVVSAVSFASNIATGTAPITVISTTKVSNLNADFVDGYNTSITSSANTIVVRDANSNISGNNLTATGLISATGNVTGGNLTTVGLVSATGNVTGGNVNATGNVTGGNLTTTGLISATGNVTGGNVNATGNVSGLYIIGNGSYLTGINTGSSNQIINGNSNVNIASANGNITLSATGVANVIVVTSTGVNVSGTLNTGSGVITGNGSGLSSIVGLNVTGQVGNALIAGTVYTAAQPNITSVGTLTSLAVTGNISMSAGQILQWNSDAGISRSSAAVLSIGNGTNNDSSGTLNLARLLATANVTAPQLISTVATGTAPFVVTSTTQVANLSVATAGTAGTVTTAAQPNITSVGTLTSLAVTGNITGANVNGNYFGNGAGLTGSASAFTANNANYLGGYSWASPPQIGSSTANYGTFSGLTVNGTISSANITSSGNVSAANVNVTTGVIYGNGSGLSAITGANVTGTVANATYAVSAGSAATATNATYATSAGSAATATTATYATTAGTAGSATTAGTVTTNAQPNITSVGTLTSLAVTGNISAANVTANHFGNGSGLSSIAGANVTGTVANATYATSAGTATSATTATIATIAAAVTANNQPNITSVSTSFSNLTFAANGNITMSGANSTLSGANLVNANYFTGTLTTATQPNITSVGTLTGLTVGGNAQISSLGVGTAAVGTAGEIVATNNIIAYYSDGRLKDVLGTIESPIEKIKQISGVRFTSNDTAAKYGYTDKKVQIGVIAQEIEAILPEIVVPAPFDMGTDEDGNPISKSGENYKTVHYDKIIPLLIEAIKEQQKQIEELQSRISNGNS